MSLYLPNSASLDLEGKREVVWNWILFKIIFGCGKMDEVCEVMPGQSFADFSYRNPNQQFLTSDELEAFIEES